MALPTRVKFNHPADGWITGWVEAQGEGGPENFDVVTFPSTSPVEKFPNVPQGHGSGHYQPFK